MFGLGLGVAVLFDATVVRMLFVPAAMKLLGDRAWHLPRWLDRIVPDLDIEGHQLQHELRHAGAAVTEVSAGETVPGVVDEPGRRDGEQGTSPDEERALEPVA
jgi:RND superfamily putative drug exporter